MKKIVAIIMSMVMGMFVTIPVMAATKCADGEKDCVDTAILDGRSDIEGVLNLVVEIMTVGIGILGVIGIVVAGIQYLTSAGNEEQARKAKRRIFEIIIGLFAYVVIYAVLYWLLPGFKPFGG